MFKFSQHSSTIITLIVVMQATTAFGNPIYGAKNHGNIIKRSIDDNRNYLFKITDFLGIKRNNEIDSKPEFVSTIDILRLLNEEYAMKEFYCVVNKGPCDSVGLRLKASIPEELNSGCNRCTSTEMNNIRRIINYVKTNYPEFWVRIEPIYKKKKNRE